MPDATKSPRLALPLLAVGQAQKEITHNEALVLIDALLCPVAEAAGTDTPPTAPAEGQAWIVGSAPVGEWAGQAHRLAIATTGGWRFATLPEGANVLVGPAGVAWRRVASGWQAPVAIPPASGGSTVDGECRAAVSALISALAAQGLVITP